VGAGTRSTGDTRISPTAPVKPVPTVSPEDLRKLLAVKGNGRFNDHRNRLILLVLVDTGCRVGELLNMKLTDVNVSTNTVTISGKSGPRTVGFGARTATELRRYLRARSGHKHRDLPDLLLTTKGSMNYKALQPVVTRYCQRAGVAHVHPHQLRHTWATTQLGTDAGELTVQHAGGWTGTASMRRYVREATARRAAELNQRHSIADNL